MHFKVINFDDIYKPENVITSTDYISSGKKEKFNDDGLFSERIFGENADDTSIDTIGWILFKGFKVISPLHFERLKKVFKNKPLNKMLSYETKTNETGELLPVENLANDWYNIGIIGFINNFEQILEELGNKEVPEYKTIKKVYDDGLLFIDKFPVISSKLRPGMIIKGSKNKNKNKKITKTTVKYDDINGLYNFILKYSLDIQKNLETIGGIDHIEDECNADIKAGIYPMLYNLQDYCNQVIIYIINNFLKEKKGTLRKHIASSRVNYSARNVLTPRLKGNINDVELPYLTFLELFRFPLTNMIVKGEGITYNEADEYIQNSKRYFNKKLYNYMNEYIKNSKEGVSILLNRNPSIAIGSILQLNVAGVKSDFSDLTISVSNNILSNLNADYDGDVLNIFALLTQEQKHYFDTLKPTNLIIDKNNGKFDRGFSLSKDARYGLEILTKI
jgi:hypothetical protein